MTRKPLNEILNLPIPEEEIFRIAAAVPEPLISWYRQNARDLPWRENPEPYRVWVSEIMLQQTRVEAVKPYYRRFLEALPDVAALADAPEEQLMKLWEGLGYYSRARNLQKAARQIMERHGGKLPPSYELLLDLAGFGEYTAGAVASIAFGIPVPAVDGNVLRVFSRVLASDSDIMAPAVRKGCRSLLLETMPQSCPGDYNQALMELGATLCAPNGPPNCMACPLSHLCRAYLNGNPSAFPVKAPKKERRGFGNFPGRRGTFPRRKPAKRWENGGLSRKNGIPSARPNIFLLIWSGGWPGFWPSVKKSSRRKACAW